MKDNLRLLTGGDNPSQLKESLKKIREDLPYLLDYYILWAQIAHTKFEALKNQGFTEAQALELCR